jgi:multidrug efflux pump subunit AcrA (membrane-fusion protein)
LIILLLTGTIGTLVYANGNHDDAAPVEAKQTEQVVVRKVGDVDADGISQEGLSSFYGEIVSKDVASINPSRDGVISSWEVSVGDSVSAGEVLGYVTVTGVGAEQQQQLAQQQANALKAQLDLELAKKIAVDSAKVFTKAKDQYNTLAENQNQAYGSIKGKSTSQGEIESLARVSFSQIYPLIGIPTTSTPQGASLNANGTSLFNPKTYLGIKYGLGIKKENETYGYQGFIISYAKKIGDGSVTISDLQEFFRRTSEIIGESYPQGDTLTQSDLDKTVEFLKDYQTKVAEASTRYRDQALVGVDLQKSIVSFNTDLDLKNLDQQNAQSKAENEAKGAELLAQKLAVSAGGVIPILATKSGIVATVEKNVGDYVTISQRIGFISNSNPRKSVRFTVPPSWKDINKGDTLSISWRPEYSMGSATITGISPVIDEKGGYQAEAVISKETVFPVGASVRIIPENSKKGVFVNRKAIVFEDVTPSVWIVTENDTVRKQEVKVGRALGEYVEILSGLERGFSYLVILDPQVVLENGKPVSEVIKTNTKVDSATPKVIKNEATPHSHDE